MPVSRNITSKDPDLAIGDLPRRSRILAPHATGGFALLQKAGLVNNKHCIIIGQRFQRVIPDDVAQIIGVPAPATQDCLLTLGARITRRLRAHPPRFATFIAKQAIQEQARRRGNPLLIEQRANAGLHPTQR